MAWHGNPRAWTGKYWHCQPWGMARHVMARDIPDLSALAVQHRGRPGRMLGAIKIIQRMRTHNSETKTAKKATKNKQKNLQEEGDREENEGGDGEDEK